MFSHPLPAPQKKSLSFLQPKSPKNCPAKPPHCRGSLCTAMKMHLSALWRLLKDLSCRQHTSLFGKVSQKTVISRQKYPKVIEGNYIKTHWADEKYSNRNRFPMAKPWGGEKGQARTMASQGPWMDTDHPVRTPNLLNTTFPQETQW